MNLTDKRHLADAWWRFCLRLMLFLSVLTLIFLSAYRLLCVLCLLLNNSARIRLPKNVT